MNWHPMSEKPQDESAVYIIQTSDQGYQAAELRDGIFESYPAGEMTQYLHFPETVVRWAVAETGVVEPVAESRRKDVHSAKLTANEMIDYVTRVTQEDIDFLESVYEQAKLILTYGNRTKSDGGER